MEGAAMKWQGRRRSGNVEDRRRIGGRGIAVGGGLGGIAIIVLYLILGGNPSELLSNLQTGAPASTAESGAPLTEKEQEMGEFVSVVLADTEDVWGAEFERMGRTYEQPHLVLFSGQVDSACGYAGAAVGPFYCPGDGKVYIDLEYFEDMQRELDAPGDFALAYVIAHEVGHHVQNLLGISDQVTKQQSRLSESKANALSVRMELQADFLAGVWAHNARERADFLDQADIEEGLNAASAVGDDRIMKKTQGRVVPDAFTHGTSEQRVRWFKKGLETGDFNQGDTFSTTRL
jgi:predicted metalloprotease